MADLFNIIASNYTAVGSANNYSQTKYVNVEPSLYEGRWSGRYADNTAFTLNVSDVEGFRAKVRYQSGATVKFQDVMIKDNSFRIGDSRFTLTKQGTAQIKTVMTNPANGQSSMETAYAKQG